MSVLLGVEEISFAYLEQRVVRDVSFEIEPGEFFGLLGPSGSGKSTILRLIAGFERCERGAIHLDGRCVVSETEFLAPERRGIGYVFQDYALFPHLSVLENVRFGLHGLPEEGARALALRALGEVGLSELAGRMPRSLSGGEQQRVALARAVVPGPKLLLLDEPFSSLDPGSREETRKSVRKFLKEKQIAALLVTHDQEEALSFCDRVGVLREGRLLKVQQPEALYGRPGSAFVAGFLGGTNVLAGVAASGTARTILGDVSLDGDAAGEVSLSIRPEHIELTEPTRGAATATVEERTYYGHDLMLRVRVASEQILVRTTYRCRFREGDRVGLELREKAHLLER